MCGSSYTITGLSKADRIAWDIIICISECSVGFWVFTTFSVQLYSRISICKVKPCDMKPVDAIKDWTHSHPGSCWDHCSKWFKTNKQIKLSTAIMQIMLHNFVAVTDLEQKCVGLWAALKRNAFFASIITVSSQRLKSNNHYSSWYQ